jgi:hypothetical protein
MKEGMESREWRIGLAQLAKIVIFAATHPLGALTPAMGFKRSLVRIQSPRLLGE